LLLLLLEEPLCIDDKEKSKFLLEFDMEVLLVCIEDREKSKFRLELIREPLREETEALHSVRLDPLMEPRRLKHCSEEMELSRLCIDASFLDDDMLTVEARLRLEFWRWGCWRRAASLREDNCV